MLPANKYASRFLMVSLNRDAILHESTISETRKAKQNDGLIRVGRCLWCDDRVDKGTRWGDKSTPGMAALIWIGHSERMLQADELCHALADQLDSPDFDVGNIPLISTLVGCCQGPISVDKEALTV